PRRDETLGSAAADSGRIRHLALFAHWHGPSGSRFSVLPVYGLAEHVHVLEDIALAAHPQRARRGPWKIPLRPSGTALEGHVLHPDVICRDRHGCRGRGIGGRWDDDSLRGIVVGA